MKLCLTVFTAVCAFSQQSAPVNITNARLETHAISVSLEDEMRRLSAAAQTPEWAGYVVPAVQGQNGNCCGSSDRCCGACALEGKNASSQSTAASAPTAAVHLEGAQSMLVLFRLENHGIDRIRTFASDCPIDADGLAMHILTGVSSNASVAYLESQAPARRGAVMAIALHGDSVADTALERLAAAANPEKVREDVAFWSGSARAARGVQLLKKMAENDPSDRVREKVMFALSISKDPGALPLLLTSARQDASSKVRSQALFWLAHKAGEKETAAIARAVNEDPDLKVKRQAVFALHELPRDQGIPLLIQVARTNKDPQVRKQAMFWLGQTNDPRAVKFFEDVLTK